MSMAPWDERKRRQVIKDHRIDFARIDDVFDDPHAIYIEDFDHNDSEERWKIIARSSEYGLICVVITFRDEDIHLITARHAERWMVNDYEEQRKRT